MPAQNSSITFWHRLEPRPRAASIQRSLAAEVRDPLWMLGRQWQVGEFQGEDAGSPVFVEMLSTHSPIVGWRAEGQPTQALDKDEPLEKTVGGELFFPDLSIQVELGQTLERLLAEAGAAPSIANLRTKYPLQPAAEADLARMPDQAQARFLRLCAGRAIDGVAVYADSQNLLAAAVDEGLQKALGRFVHWVEELFGALAPGWAIDPPAWQPARLEYDAEVVATLPDGQPGVLAARPDLDGVLGWHGFDHRPGAAVEATTPTGQVESRQWRVLPAHVRFRGMPRARWWEFEQGTTDFGDIKPDKRDLARLVMIDFMLVHSNDWFVIPYELAVGSLCRIDALTVHDVFGAQARIGRADAYQEGWTMFSTSVEGQPGNLADFFLLPPSAATVLQPGLTLEEVQFVRDEMANLVWAIEHLTENGIGQPWPGHERAFAAQESLPPEPTQAGAGQKDKRLLHYRIQTTVPEHWIPFLPVLVDGSTREIALKRGAQQRTLPDGSVTPVQPLSRTLRPVVDPYWIREEEVPRSGVRVLRTVYRSRWIDGSTHLWIARRKVAGRGEGSSGLRFDLAEEE